MFLWIETRSFELFGKCRDGRMPVSRKVCDSHLVPAEIACFWRREHFFVTVERMSSEKRVAKPGKTGTGAYIRRMAAIRGFEIAQWWIPRFEDGMRLPILVSRSKPIGANQGQSFGQLRDTKLNCVVIIYFFALPILFAKYQKLYGNLSNFRKVRGKKIHS